MQGSAHVFFKPTGRENVTAQTADEALLDLKNGLQSHNKAYIYHCTNHYMCPIGFEDNFILIGDCSGAYPTFHMSKWEDIVTDLSVLLPDFLNIRVPLAGVQTKTE